MSDPILDQAARLSSDAGHPELMPKVNELLHETIGKLDDINRQNPDVFDAREKMAQLVTEQQVELSRVLGKDIPEG